MKSNKINIQGLSDIDDPHYRYTMIKLNVIKQRNKTVIDNLHLVAADLDRNPIMIANFFRKKMGIAMTYKNGILSTSADLNYSHFDNPLREFIQLYVLCGVCKLPETIFFIKDNKVSLECKCCSNKTVIK